MAQTRYLDLAGLKEFKTLFRGQIDVELEKSFKSAKFDESTRVLSLFKSESTDGNADFTVTIPKTDVSGLMEKLTTTNVGNIVITKADGTVEDAGVALSDLATKAEVKTVNDKIGEVTEDKTVVEMIEDAKKAATYDDTQVKADIKKNADAIEAHKTAVDEKVTTLVGEDTGKSVRTIANEELAAQLIPEGAKDSLDTLQEIATWIQNHPDDASAMNDAITKLQAIVDGIGDTEAGEKATVVAYVTDAIAALNIGDYAKAAELTELAGHVTALEGLVDSEKVAKWDAAEQNAKTYADSLGVKYDAAGSATAAETNSKAYADGLNSAMDAKVEEASDRITDLETKVGDGVEAITNEEIQAIFNE